MGLVTGLEQRKILIPTAQNPLLGLLGAARDTYTGRDIDELDSLEAPAVFQAIRLLSETVGSLPLHLYRRKERGKDKAINHDTYNLLHLKPNSEMGTMAFREAMMGQILLYGTGYAEKAFDGMGRIIELWPLLSSHMDVGRQRNGRLFYRYRLPQGGEDKFFDEDLILRIPGFSGQGLLGYQPVVKMKQAIGLTLALEEFGARFFGNDARPSAVLEHPDSLDPKAKQQLRKAWEDMHKGLTNAHRIAILESGMKLHAYGIDPQAAQALESRKFQVTEVARIFNIQPHLLFDLERSTYSNIEQQSLEFVIYTLRPWLVRLEQAYTIQLLSDKEQKKYFWEHKVDGLLRGDIQSRYSAYATGRNWGWLCADDIREFENLNPLPNGKGQIYLQPLNMVDVNKPIMPAQKPPPKQGNEDENTEEDTDQEEKSLLIEKRAKAQIIEGRTRIRHSFEPLFREIARKLVRRETVAIGKAIKKYVGNRGAYDLEQWLEEFYGSLPQHIKRDFLPVLRTYAEQVQAQVAGEIGIDVGMTQELEQFVDEYLGAFTQRHILSSIGQLQELIHQTEMEEMAGTLETRLDEWQETRADKIAHRETRQMMEAVASVLIFGAGFRLVWVAVGKSCPYCLALDGSTIEAQESFVSEGEFSPDGTEAPMKIRGHKKHPPLHAFCDCMALAG